MPGQRCGLDSQGRMEKPRLILWCQGGAGPLPRQTQGQPDLTSTSPSGQLLSQAREGRPWPSAPRRPAPPRKGRSNQESREQWLTAPSFPEPLPRETGPRDSHAMSPREACSTASGPGWVPGPWLTGGWQVPSCLCDASFTPDTSTQAWWQAPALEALWGTHGRKAGPFPPSARPPCPCPHMAPETHMQNREGGVPCPASQRNSGQ